MAVGSQVELGNWITGIILRFAQQWADHTNV
jgi:hypothetical protein